jgi:hypothetical protein
MPPRKLEIDLGDLTWLLNSEPTQENLVRAEKLRTMLDNRLAVVDGTISTWKKRLGIFAAKNETKPEQSAQSANRTIGNLFEFYHSNPKSPYFEKRYSSRRNSDSLTKHILADLKDTKIADITEADVRQCHEQWMARVASKGKGDGVSMAHALITQLRIVVNYGAKELKDSDCLHLSFILRNLRLKAVPPKRSAQLNESQVKAIIAAAHKMGWHSIALAQAIQFEWELGQKNIIGEWVPISEKGQSEITRDGLKWLYGLRWNEIDGNFVLTHTSSQTLETVTINLKSKTLVVDELKRFHNPRKTSGAMIVHDQTGLPWQNFTFRATWREIAREAGVSDLMRMDSRPPKSPRAKHAAKSAQEATS